MLPLHTITTSPVGGWNVMATPARKLSMYGVVAVSRRVHALPFHVQVSLFWMLPQPPNMST